VKLAIIALAVLMSNATSDLSSRPDDTPEKLRALIAAEHGLVQKAKLEIRLADLLLEKARKEYTEDDVDKGKASIEEMAAVTEQAYNHLFETHRDARSGPGAFKDTEILMRSFIRRLTDLGKSQPFDDRPPIEKALARMREMHEDLLNGIMRIRKKEEK
jgi:hypothetical protein